MMDTTDEIVSSVVYWVAVHHQNLFCFSFMDNEKDVTFLQELGLLEREMFCPMWGRNLGLWWSESFIDIDGGAEK